MVTAEQRVWVLPLPYSSPPLSLNSRMHHMKVARLSKQIQSDVGWLARHQKIPQLERMHVALVWHPKVIKTRDSDNPAPTVKAAIDGLKKVGVVVDDDAQHVSNTVLIRMTPSTHHDSRKGWKHGLWLVVHRVDDLSNSPATPVELLG